MTRGRNDRGEWQGWGKGGVSIKVGRECRKCMKDERKEDQEGCAKEINVEKWKDGGVTGGERQYII